MMEGDGYRAPVTGRIIAVGMLGALVLVAGLFTSVGRIVLAIAAVGLALVLGIGLAVQRHIKQKYPPVMFSRDEASRAVEMIESAGSRLATGDSAGFVISPSLDASGDAAGQIWLFATSDGLVGRVAVELALPGSLDASTVPSRLESLLDDGWEIQSSQAGEWVVLTRSGGVDTGEVVSVVVDRLTTLFDISHRSEWSCRAIA